MVRLHTYGKHRRRRTASKTLTAHIATQGKTTKTLRRMPGMPQFAAFRSATQGKLPKNVRREQLHVRSRSQMHSKGMSAEEIGRLLDMDLGGILMVL